MSISLLTIVGIGFLGIIALAAIALVVALVFSGTNSGEKSNKK